MQFFYRVRFVAPEESGGCMRVDVTKLQVLTACASGNPIFYCHANDRDHAPHFEVSRDGDAVLLAGTMLFKVKVNPQTRNRIDVYMDVEQARRLGAALEGAAGGAPAFAPQVSNADPHAARRGPVELPDIVWARYLRTLEAHAYIGPTLRLSKREGYLNVDYEKPHGTHIRMGLQEIHLGLPLDGPSGMHDRSAERLVHVDEAELQRPIGRPPERNPVPKVEGGVAILLGRSQAAGLGRLLSGFDPNAG